MSKRKKIALIAGIVVVAWVAINLSIYYSDSRVRQQIDSAAHSGSNDGGANSDAPVISTIGYFDFGRSGDQYSAWFALSDTHSKTYSADGKLKIEFTTESGELIYSDTQNFKASDFSNYGFPNRGGQFYGYTWHLDSSKIRNHDPQAITANLQITLADGRTFSSHATEYGL